MQTFLPYESFTDSARVLDRQRLGKQRVEVLQLLKAMDATTHKQGWTNHPATRMWRPYRGMLGVYGMVICLEWRSRGYKDTCYEKIRERVLGLPIIVPHWLGDEEVHRSHRSNLVRKNPKHYRPVFGDVPDDLPYVWPVEASRSVIFEAGTFEDTF